MRRALVVAALLAWPGAASAQLRVIVSGGFRGAYDELLPEFERTAGIQVTTLSGSSVGTGPNAVASQLRSGVTADVVILARQGLAELAGDGRIVPGTEVDLAESAIGMIVRAGAPRPDIGTVEAFRRTLLSAPSVAVSTSASGVYLTTQLFPRLGIAEAMAGKLVVSDSVAAAVGTGRAAIGLQQVSEVLRVPGADYVGRIPAEAQLVTVFAAAIVGGRSHLDESRRLIEFLASDGAAAAIRRNGMEPAARR
jgi:molybdate transport system substrate-binding protein